MKGAQRLTKASLLAALGVSVALSGCSQEPASGGGDGNAGGGDGPKVKLVFWSHQAEAFNDNYKKLIDSYMKAHPNVEISYQSFPYDVYNQKLKASFSAQNPPDIAEVFGTWVPEYSKNGLLSEVPGGEEAGKAYYEAPLGGFKWNGKLYGLPLEFNIENGGMLAHPQMFKDKGLAYPPKTWTELVESAKALTVRDGSGMKVKGFDFISGDNITFTFLSMILQQNGKYWASDGHVNFQTPEAVKAMTALKDLVVRDQVTDLTAFGGQLDSSDYFFKGGAAMTYRGPWTIAAGLDNYKAKDFEYVPVPSFTDNPPSFAAESGWGLVVSKKSKASKEAWDFIQFLSSKENLKAWNLGTFTVPAKKEVAEDSEFVSKNPFMRTSVGLLPHGQWIGLIWDRDYFFKQINDHFQLMVSGKVTVENGLKAIEKAVNENQDQHK